MNGSIRSHRHQLGILGSALALAALASAATFSGAQAQSGGTDVFRVEEDWELIVGDADASINAPQVTVTISPWDMGYGYCAFDVNYHTQPDYSAGGLQIHTWDPIDPIEIGRAHV